MKKLLLPLLCFGLLSNSVFAQFSDRQGTTTSTRHGKMLSIKILVQAGEDVVTPVTPVGSLCRQEGYQGMHFYLPHTYLPLYPLNFTSVYDGNSIARGSVNDSLQDTFIFSQGPTSSMHGLPVELQTELIQHGWSFNSNYTFFRGVGGGAGGSTRLSAVWDCL